MRHLDLFSGIGGFAYAAQQVWGAEYENVGFVEIDPFCQNVLRKNFPGVPIFNDIRFLAYAKDKGLEGSDAEGNTQAGRRFGEHFAGVDLITGGFPCQPFSQSGRRRGTSDDRYLWPEMYQIIRDAAPKWVIAENVSGLVTWDDGVVFETVCADLEAAGYEVQAFVIPAAAVGAPHRRDRVWFVANRHGEGRDERRRLRATGPQRERRRQSGDSFAGEWPEVAARLCRVDDGLPPRVVRLPDGTTISEARWRKEAIKAYGNAIVPQVAMQIMEAIKTYD